MRKPQVFVASSAESLDVAKAIHVNLDHTFEVTTWPNGTFELSSIALVDLLDKSSQVDFAIFIFSPDDLAIIREKEVKITRDNVVFELGLFTGSLGKDRCFIIHPRGEELHLPSDLIGITTADYEANRIDNDLTSAVTYACTKIEKRAKELGGLYREAISSKTRLSTNPVTYELSDNDFEILTICTKGKTSHLGGLSHDVLSNFTNINNDAAVNISLMKLQRMGLIETNIEEDVGLNHTYTYYTFTITEAGIDIILNNESRIPTHTPEPTPAPDPNQINFDDDIPF